MTTIATDGVTMAADSLTARDRLITQRTMIKLFHLEDGRVAGMSGCTTGWGDALDYLNGHLDELDTDSMTALILNHDGTVLGMDQRGKFWDEMVPAAIGSGEDFAIGAMMAGVLPAIAVGIAAKRDTQTGGDVINVKCCEQPAVTVPQSFWVGLLRRIRK